MMMVALVNDVSDDVDGVGVGGKSIEVDNNNWAPEPMCNGVLSLHYGLVRLLRVFALLNIYLENFEHFNLQIIKVK